MAEVREVVVPDIGDFSDVPIIEVLVSEGDSVSPEDPLVTLESDKATMDVPAPFAGTVAELKVGVGDTVSEGSLLLTLSVDSNGAQPSGQPAATPTAPATEAGAGQAHGIEDAIQAEASGGDGAAPAAPASPQAVATQDESEVPPYASPAVRRLARELGVALSAVQGSGRKGRITKEDVEAASKAPAAAPAKAAPAGAAIEGLDMAPWPKIDFEKFGSVERRPLAGDLRRGGRRRRGRLRLRRRLRLAGRILGFRLRGGVDRLGPGVARLRGRRRRRRRGAVAGGAVDLDGQQLGALGHLVADRHLQLGDLARHRRRDVHRRLIGLQRDQRVLRGHGVADRHQHLDDGDVVEVADVRYEYLLGRHRRLPYTVHGAGRSVSMPYLSIAFLGASLSTAPLFASSVRAASATWWRSTSKKLRSVLR